MIRASRITTGGLGCRTYVLGYCGRSTEGFAAVEAGVGLLLVVEVEEAHAARSSNGTARKGRGTG